jgi:transposase-like protein
MSSNTILKESKEELFGTLSHKNPIFPTKLAVFYSRLPIGHSFQLNTFIDRHTWASLIFCFLAKANQDKLFKLMKFGEEKLHQTTLLHIPGLFSKKVQYCPECLEVDEERFGICYAHRIHQLSFVDYCPDHYVKLIEVCPQCNHPLSKDYAEELISQPTCKICKADMKSTLVDEKNSTIMFKNNLMWDLCRLRDCSDQLSAEVIQLKLMMKLWELKYMHYRGHIMRLEFLSEISSNHSSEQLEVVGLDKAELVSKHFISRFLTLDHMRSHVLFYTLLIRYLFHSVNEFLHYNYAMAIPIPFGNGPWECYSTVCVGFERKVINHCIRESKGSGGSTVSVKFVCPLCGYTYSRLWKPGKDESRKPLVVSMGHLWQEKVRNLYNAGYSIFQIRKKTGFSEVAIQTWIKRQNFERINPSGSVVPDDTSLAMKEPAVTGVMNNKDLFRSVLLNSAREKQTTKRLTMLRSHPREYNWLYRHDTEWLEGHFPRQRKVREKIDLTEFDTTLAEKIRTVSTQLRLTCTKKVGKLTILNQLTPKEKARLTSTMKERLPESYKVLQQSVEDLDSYLFRSINRIFMKLRKKGYRTVTFRAVTSNFKQFGQCLDETRTQIEVLLEKLNREL